MGEIGFLIFNIYTLFDMFYGKSTFVNGISHTNPTLILNFWPIRMNEVTWEYIYYRLKLYQT